MFRFIILCKKTSRLKFISKYFGFNRQQRNGLAVLVGLCALLLAVRLIYPSFISASPIQAYNLPLIAQQLDSTDAIEEDEKTPALPETSKSAKLFPFDPNTVNAEQLSELGFSKKTIGTFLKFRDKGFKFKNKEDLKKVYGISAFQYNQLEPYIQISSSKETTEINVVTTERETSVPVKSKLNIEINSADSLAMMSVPGIGNTYARRIIKYREMLGGFNSIEQLKEVYGLTEEVYQKIYSNFTVDNSRLRKLDLNKDDFKSINRHPYLSYEMTKRIFDWRKKTLISDVNLDDVLGDAAIGAKLRPYLVFGP